MTKVSLATAEEAAKANRAKAEEAAQGAAYDGRKRRPRTSTKSAAVIFRCTPAKRAQLLELADRLETSIAQTMERALDALEEKLEREAKRKAAKSA